MMLLYLLALATLVSGCRGIVVALGDPIKLANGTDNAAQFLDGLAAGKFVGQELLIDKVTEYHPDLGNVTRPFTEKLNVVFLSSEDTKIVCDWLHGDGPLDDLSLDLQGLDVLISNWGNSRCQMRDFDRVCMLAPISIGVDRKRYPGTVSTRMFGWSEDYKKKVASCSFLEARLVKVELFDLKESIVFRAELSMDEPEAHDLYRSFWIQFIFRALVPMYFFYVAIVSFGILVERHLGNGRTLGSHSFVLILNLVQGFGFGILNGIGLHDLGKTFSESFVMITFTNLFSLSIATDLIFARLLRDVYRGFSLQNRAKQSRIRNWIIIAIGIIGIEFLSVTAYVVNPSVFNRVIVMNIMMPAALILLSICITIYVVSLMRKIAKVLVEAWASKMNQTLSTIAQGEDGTTKDPQIIARETAQLSLAEQYYFWSKISLVSVFFIYLAGLVSLLGFMHKTPQVYLMFVFAIDFGKALNMHAQSSACKPLPKTRITPTWKAQHVPDTNETSALEPTLAISILSPFAVPKRPNQE